MTQRTIRKPSFFCAVGAVSVLLFANASCQRESNVLLIDDPVEVAHQETGLPVAEAKPAPQPESAESPESQPTPPTFDARVAAEATFDAKGTTVELKGGVFSGFASDADREKWRKVKVVRGEGLLLASGLDAFAQLPDLTEFLWLDAQLEKSADLENAFNRLARAPKLKKLRLTRLRLEDDSFPLFALKALSAAPSLVDLDVSGSPVTGAELADVDWTKGYAKLTKLNLYQTQAGDAGVVAILPLADRLTWLNLDDARLTPSCAGNLSRFAELTFLHVGRSALDDSSVNELAKLSKLKKTHVTRTAITESGADRLRAALPECEVVSQPEN